MVVLARQGSLGGTQYVESWLRLNVIARWKLHRQSLFRGRILPPAPVATTAVHLHHAGSHHD